MKRRLLTVLIGMTILAVLIGIDCYYHRTPLKAFELCVVLINIALGVFNFRKSK